MIDCPQCHSLIPEERINAADFFSCLKCRGSLRVVIFPALFQPSQAAVSGQSLVLDQAACFYHAEKKAIIPCSNCGRFLCALCDIDFDGQHLCTQCLQSGAKKKRLRNINHDVCCYDKIAFNLAVLPIFTVFFTFITAPIAVFMSIRYWKTQSLTGSKWRFVFSFIFGVIQIVLWVVGIKSGFFS